MSSFSPQQIEVATRAWLDAMRREWISRNPGEMCPIPFWGQIDMATRLAFVRCIKAALLATDPMNVARVMEQNQS